MQLAFIMDPPTSITPWKDTTFAMLLAAQARGHQCFYIAPCALLADENGVHARAQAIEVIDQRHDFYRLGDDIDKKLADFDAVLMRQDPPFDMNYVYTTYLLEMAENEGACVVNKPRALRDFNEKLAILRFPQCCADTLVSSEKSRLKAFVQTHSDCVLKPLDGMGGASIFRLRAGEDNSNVIIDTLTEHGRRPIMAQRFIDRISEGDKRVLLVDGEAVPFSLARIPGEGDFRGNLAQGGRGEGRELTERERWIAEQVGPTLRQAGIRFAGLDVIGDYLTEVNVTSPTCVRELDAQFGLDIAGDFIERLTRDLSP
jgi:glutathione synthase